MRAVDLMEVLAIDREAADALVLAGYTTIDDLQNADILDLAMIRPVGTTGAQWIKAKLKKLMAESPSGPGRGIVPLPSASSVPEPSKARSTPPPPEPAKVEAPPSPPPPPEPAKAPPTPEPVKETAPPAPAPEPVKEAARPAGSLPPPPHIARQQTGTPPPHVSREGAEAPTLRPTPEPVEKATPVPVDTPAAAPPARTPAVKEEPVPVPPTEPAPAAPVAGAAGPSFIDRLMDNKRNVLAIGAIAVVALLIGVFVIWPLFAVERAPDFEIRTIDGEKIRLSDYRGDKIVLLDFMFSGCIGCKKGMPHLKEVYEKYGDEIVILSVSDVEGSEERDALRDLKEEEGAEWIFGQIDPQVTIDYNVDKYPTYFIIDKEGYVTFKSSYADADKLSEEIDKVKEGRSERLAVVSLGVYGLAFVAGMVTFFSPCAYPLMPAYMSYYVTMDSKEEEDVKVAMRRGAIQGTIPAMAMLLFFGMIGLAVGLFGYFIFGFLGYIGLVMGIMILGFGFAMVRDIDIPFHYITTPLKGIARKLYHIVKKLTGGIISKETAEKGISRVTGKEIKLDSEEQGAFGLFTYGLVYAAASSACVAPLFILVLTVGIAQGGVFAGFMVVLLYGLGMGVLMVTFTALIAGSKLKLINFMKVHMKTIEMVSGIIMMLAGIMLIYFWYLAEVA